MKRRTFDLILTAVGAVLTVGLLIAGSLLLWGASFTTSSVHDQLAKQEIFFPAAGSAEAMNPAIGQCVRDNAGQQLLTGAQAECYANHFIAVHLSEMPYGGVYSKVSAAAMADPNNASLKALELTVFQGTTLRGLLLEAYAFSVFGMIATISAIAAFVGAFLLLIATILGFLHYRKTPDDVEFPKPVSAPEAA